MKQPNDFQLPPEDKMPIATLSKDSNNNDTESTGSDMETDSDLETDSYMCMIRTALMGVHLRLRCRW